MHSPTCLRFAVAVLVLGGILPVSAAPYLVYEGTLTQSSTITAAEDATIQAKINAKIAKFHMLSAAVQKEITSAVAKSVASTTDELFMVTDEQNVANYAFIALDPTKSGGKVLRITGSNLAPTDVPQNFISGFQFPSSGGLGILRLAIKKATGNDPVTGNPGSYVLQAYGTGPINSTANFKIAPPQAAETFILEVNGVKGATVTVPAFPAIFSNGQFISSVSGSVFGYYFDDDAAQSIGGASTKGTFTMAVNAMFTQLANNGGKYAPSKTNVANIAPVTASTADAYKVFIKAVFNAANPGH